MSSSYLKLGTGKLSQVLVRHSCMFQFQQFLLLLANLLQLALLAFELRLHLELLEETFGLKFRLNLNIISNQEA